jgi:hypothetical protein
MENGLEHGPFIDYTDIICPRKMVMFIDFP